MKKKRKNAKQPELVEGRARVLYNDGVKRDLKVGEIVYIREIPNMRGHCVVLRNRKAPLVGYHLDRFELLTDDD